MLKFLKSKTLFIVLALMCVLFNVLFFVLCNLKEAKAGVWIGYGFIMLAFALLMLLAFFFKMKSPNSMTAIMPFVVSSAAYFIVTVVANAIMMGLNLEKPVAPAVINVVLVIVFAIITIISFKSFSRVDDNQQMLKERAEKKLFTSVKVSSLISIAKDPDVLKGLKKLKETIDYSSPASTSATEGYETQFDAKLSQIGAMLASEEDKQEILDVIAEAAQLLKLRNQTLMIHGA